MPTFPLKQFQAFIRGFQERHALSGRQLAEVLDTKPSTLNGWLSGRRKISPDALEMLSERLSVANQVLNAVRRS